jgi:GTP pyrophosphokinase
VPIKTEIVNGDIVEISTSPQQRPHHDWLSIVVTTRARNKIRSWLKREEKERAVEVGRKLLERELRKGGHQLKQAFGSEEMSRAVASHGLGGEEDLLAAVGFGKVAASSVVTSLFPDESEDRAEELVTQPRRPAGKDSAALEVTGDADFLVYVAKCCNPLPGESIVGYVTRGKGVAVHSRSCPNVKNLLYHPEREIEVQWASSAGKGTEAGSRVDVDMTFRDRTGMLASISQTISAEGSDILSCQLRTEKNDTGFAAMTILVRDAPQLARIMDRLRALSGMLEVERRGQTGHETGSRQ